MVYEAATTSILTTATANLGLVALRAPATETMRLRELGVTLVSATASRLGLVRATTVSATPTGAVVGQPVIPGAPVGGSEIVTGWTTTPTLAASYMRRISLPAAIGAGFIWTWPADDPFMVGDGRVISELVIANLVAVACSTFEVYAKWEA